jgi:aryl-alcohol dehydrogenase-like predicted oxidoreductase
MIQLPHRPLAATGLQVSALGLGTVKWGRNQQVKYPAFELPSDATLHALLDLAEAHGLNLLDTAPAYGIAEERVGRILGERPQSAFLIMTKTGEEFVNGVSHYHFTKKHTEASIHRSLRRLNALALDLVMVHCSADDLAVLENTAVLETLHSLRDQGLVRAIGVSTMTVAGGLRAVEMVDAVMVPFSIGYQDHLPVIAKAHHLSKAVFVKRALYSGPAADSAHTLSELLSPVLQTPGVTALMAGTINPQHLQENIHAAKFVLDRAQG